MQTYAQFGQRRRRVPPVHTVANTLHLSVQELHRRRATLKFRLVSVGVVHSILEVEVTILENRFAGDTEKR